MAELEIDREDVHNRKEKMLGFYAWVIAPKGPIKSTCLIFICNTKLYIIIWEVV